MISIAITARLGSTRLPGKCLLPFGPSTLLDVLLERMARSQRATEIVVATTVRPEDAKLEACAERHGARVFRGDVDDVLGRLAAACPESDVIVRITGDNPFTDPLWIDRAVDLHLAEKVALTASRAIDANGTWTRSLPKGLSIDVIDGPTLRKLAGAPDLTADDREHVILRLFRPPFTSRLLPTPLAGAALDLSLSIDTEDDMRRARAIAAQLGARLHDATAEEIIALA